MEFDCISSLSLSLHDYFDPQHFYKIVMIADGQSKIVDSFGIQICVF